MGVDTTLKIVDSLEERVSKDRYMSFDSKLVDMLRDEIGTLLDIDGEESPKEPFDLTKKPLVVMVVGVNGVGQTTTIGKSCRPLQGHGQESR